jgi:cell division cycle 20-like protein 1 (cofactor of APC complex)
MLATGGGSTDKTIKLWDINEMKCTRTTETGSQVCNMLFSNATDELVSTHGYSLNSIVVWKTKTMEKLTTLHGHTFRVLYLAKSPD